MVAARTLVLKGLIEGLVLHAIEREPTHGYGILKEIEESLGEAPNKNQVYPLLQRMEEDGLIRSEEVSEDTRTKQVYHLTRDGESRLREYRTVPPAFKQRMVTLFSIPPPDELEQRVEEGEADIRPAPRPRRSRPPAVGDAWVAEALEYLPASPEVRAPFARVSLNKHPGTGTWTLQVEHHEPGAYEGADVCPLTYLYLATQRLLFEAPEP